MPDLPVHRGRGSRAGPPLHAVPLQGNDAFHPPGLPRDLAQDVFKCGVLDTLRSVCICVSHPEEGSCVFHLRSRRGLRCCARILLPWHLSGRVRRQVGAYRMGCAGWHEGGRRRDSHGGGYGQSDEPGPPLGELVGARAVGLHRYRHSRLLHAGQSARPTPRETAHARSSMLQTTQPAPTCRSFCCQCAGLVSSATIRICSAAPLVATRRPALYLALLLSPGSFALCFSATSSQATLPISSRAVVAQ